MSEHPIVPAGTPLEEATAKIIDAAGKGRLALLVTDAAGNVVVGLQATGGLTELRHRPADNLWTFAGAFGGTPLVLEGSVALRNALGTEADQTPDDFGPDDYIENFGRPPEPPPRRYPVGELTKGAPAAAHWPPAPGRLPQRSHWQQDRPGQHGAPDAMPPESGGEDVDFGPPVWPLPKRRPGEALERAEEEWGPV